MTRDEVVLLASGKISKVPADLLIDEVVEARGLEETLSNRLDAMDEIESDNASDIGLIQTTYSSITSGSGVPSTTPARLGLIYIRTGAKDVYVSAGIASSSDWIKVN